MKLETCGNYTLKVIDNDGLTVGMVFSGCWVIYRVESLTLSQDGMIEVLRGKVFKKH